MWSTKSKIPLLLNGPLGSWLRSWYSGPVLAVGQLIGIERRISECDSRVTGAAIALEQHQTSAYEWQRRVQRVEGLLEAVRNDKGSQQEFGAADGIQLKAELRAQLIEAMARIQQLEKEQLIGGERQRRSFEQVATLEQVVERLRNNGR